MNTEIQPETAFRSEEFESVFEKFTKQIPGVVAATSPEGAGKREQIAEFLSDNIDGLKCSYPRLDSLTDEQTESHRDSAKLLLDQVSLLSEPRRSVYESFIRQNLLQADLVMAMKRYNEATEKDEKNSAREEFMRLNVEMYGEPDRNTYYSLLSEKIEKISSKSRSHEAQIIYEQLRDILPSEAFNSEYIDARFRPSSETVEWAHRAFTGLFSGLMSHIPDTDEPINSAYLRDIFEAIVREEFGEAAHEWRVLHKESKAISVGSQSKVVTVPIDRPPVTVAEARRLVAHEIGIHVMTAITGASTDIAPLSYGLAGYADTQEGLGKVAEQAIENRFIEAGADHYITAGLAYYDEKSFRGAFEVKWRMKLLEDLDELASPTPEQVEHARKVAADGPLLATTRIFRGTDELPLFKDLSYYNGSMEVWKYLESIRGDDLMLSLLLAGKVSTSSDHRRVVLESKSID